jgi:short-subunit dehydrogenase
MPMMNPPIRNWQGKHVWIIGASSGIGRALGELFARLGATLYVSARSQAPLDEFVRLHPTSQAFALDVTNSQSMASAFNEITCNKPLDLIVYCAGHYAPMRAQDFNLEEALKHMQINYCGALNLLGAILPSLLKQRSGHLSLVSSVAGFTGLPKSLAYGPSKAALTHLAEVLYLDLHPSNLGISVVHPGFVKTPLTSQNDFKMPALISAETAALEIVKGYEQGTFEIHFPKRFTRFLKLLRLLPYRLYFLIISRTTGL